MDDDDRDEQSRDDTHSKRDKEPNRIERAFDAVRRAGRSMMPDVGIDARGPRVRWPRGESRQYRR